jgi:hypothetical protein
VADLHLFDVPNYSVKLELTPNNRETSIGFGKALAADECGFAPFIIDRNLARASYNRIARGTVGPNRGMRDDVWGQQSLRGDSSPFLDDTLGIL